MFDLLIHFVEKALGNIRQAPLVNLLTVTTLAVSLLLFGAFLYLTVNLGQAVERWGHGLVVSLYLHPDQGPAEAEALAAELRQDAGLAEVRVVTPEQALRRLKNALADQASVVDGLEGAENPLPTSVELTLRGEPTQAMLAERVAAWSKHRQVEEVIYGREWVAGLIALVGGLRLGGIVLGSLLFLATVAIVSNTIKLAVYSRRDEIGVMKLVGATDSFVRAPFLIEGVIQGFAGALIALALLFGLHDLGAARMSATLGPLLGDAPLVFLPLRAAAYLVVGGIMLGLLGSLTAVGRHLKV